MMANDFVTAERWAPFPDFEGLYEISDLGRVRSLHRRNFMGLLSATDDSQGYPVICLNRQGKRHAKTIHRAVCRAFHGEPRPLHREVAHLNGDRPDPRARNLKWCSKGENHFHKRLHGTLLRGSSHPRSKLTEEDVIAIRSASNGDRIAISRRYGVSVHTISDIRAMRRWKHLPKASITFAGE